MSDFRMQESVGEIATEVKDAVGEMIEQGVQSAVSSPLTPQQVQQKQQEDQKQLAEARRKIEFYKKIDFDQSQVRAQTKQEETQRLQNQQSEAQVVQVEEKQKNKQPVNPALAYAGKAEFKRGVGG